MSGKDSQPIAEKKNHFLEIYQRNYLEGPKLDINGLDLEKLENLLFSIAHAHDLIGKQVQDLSSGSAGLTEVVGVLSAENAVLQKKLEKALRKPGRPSKQLDEEETKFLTKREIEIPEEAYANEALRKNQDSFWAERTASAKNAHSGRENRGGLRKMNFSEASPEPAAFSRQPFLQRDGLAEARPAPDAQGPGGKPDDKDSSEATTLSAQIKKNPSDTSSERSGFVTQLLGKGDLRTSFIMKKHNNLMTILEEPRTSAQPSPLRARPQDSLYSPKKNIKIEQLRLGFSADGKGLFNSTAEEVRKVRAPHAAVRQRPEGSETPAQADARPELLGLF